MNDIDKIVRKILIDDTFEPLRQMYIIEEMSRNDFSVSFELLTSRFQPNKRYFMTAEIIHTADLNESSDILDYKILKINQRIRLNTDFSINSPTMVKYVFSPYSVKLMALGDTPQKIIYYLLYIYEPAENLSELIRGRNFVYSTEDVLKNMLDICTTVKKCHEVNLYHNDISIGNIYVTQDRQFKLGKIDMKNLVNFSYKSTQPYSLPTPEPSVKNDIYMIGNLITVLADSASKKNQLIESRLKKIALQACRKNGGYGSIDDIINDLMRILSGKSMIIIPSLLRRLKSFTVRFRKQAVISAVVICTAVLAGAGFFIFNSISGAEKKGDINGDGVINQIDISELQDICSEVAVSEKKLTKDEKVRCDINSDGYIDMIDISALIDYVLYQEEYESDMNIKEFLKYRKKQSQ